MKSDIRYARKISAPKAEYVSSSESFSEAYLRLTPAERPLKKLYPTPTPNTISEGVKGSLALPLASMTVYSSPLWYVPATDKPIFFPILYTPPRLKLVLFVPSGAQFCQENAKSAVLCDNGIKAELEKAEKGDTDEEAIETPPMAEVTGFLSITTKGRASSPCAETLREAAKADNDSKNILDRLFIPYFLTIFSVYSLPSTVTVTEYLPGANPEKSILAGSKALAFTFPSYTV